MIKLTANGMKKRNKKRAQTIHMAKEGKGARAFKTIAVEAKTTKQIHQHGKT